jgi:hypothetical protein
MYLFIITIKALWHHKMTQKDLSVSIAKYSLAKNRGRVLRITNPIGLVYPQDIEATLIEELQ